MLNNTITIPSVDASSGEAAPVVFTRVREELDKTTYNGPYHQPDARELLTFSRSAPKQNGLSRGMCKSAIKLTRDVSVVNTAGTTHQMPLIIEVSASVPVGVDKSILYQGLIDILYGIYEESDDSGGVLQDTSLLAKLFYFQEI